MASRKKFIKFPLLIFLFSKKIPTMLVFSSGYLNYKLLRKWFKINKIFLSRSFPKNFPWKKLSPAIHHVVIVQKRSVALAPVRRSRMKVALINNPGTRHHLADRNSTAAVEALRHFANRNFLWLRGRRWRFLQFVESEK